MTELIVKQPGKRTKWTDTEIQTGLTAIALESGNCERAAVTLANSGLPIPRGTLSKWKQERHKEAYARICEEVLPELRERLAQSDDDLVREAHTLEREALARLRAELPQASVNALINMYAKAAINGAVHTDKALLRRGQPTEIKMVGNISDALKQLKRIAPGLVIEGEATEVDEKALERTSTAEVATELDERDTSGAGWPD